MLKKWERLKSEVLSRIGVKALMENNLNLKILQITGILNLILGIGGTISAYESKLPFFSNGKTILYVALDFLIFLLPSTMILPFILYAAYVLMEGNRSNKSLWLVTFCANVIWLLFFQLFMLSEFRVSKPPFGAILIPIIIPVLNIILLLLNMPKAAQQTSQSTTANEVKDSEAK